MNRTGRDDDLDDLVDGARQFIIDHDMIGDRSTNRLLVNGLAESVSDLVIGVSPFAQPSFLLLARRRKNEDQKRFGLDSTHLLGAVDLNLEQHILAVRRLG